MSTSRWGRVKQPLVPSVGAPARRNFPRDSLHPDVINSSDAIFPDAVTVSRATTLHNYPTPQRHQRHKYVAVILRLYCFCHCCSRICIHTHTYHTSFLFHRSHRAFVRSLFSICTLLFEPTDIPQTRAVSHRPSSTIDDGLQNVGRPSHCCCRFCCHCCCCRCCRCCCCYR